MSEEDKPVKAMVGVENGDMVAENPEGLLKVAMLHLKSGMLPKQYNTIEKVITATALAKQLNLPPLVAMRQIAVINGNPSLYGDLPLALVKRSKAFEWIKEYFIDDECNEICVKNKNLKNPVYGAVCVTKRKGEPEHETVFTLDDKKTAGINSPVWNKFPKDMLLYRARSRNLKSSFPECLNGVAIAEYDNHVMPEVEGQVINSVSHTGQKNLMEQIRNKFVKGVKDADEHEDKALEDKSSESAGADQRKPAKKAKTRSSKGNKRAQEAEIRADEVGIEAPPA